MKNITFEEFIKKYAPAKNSNVEDGPYNGYMFETFGEDLELVKITSREHIWTLIDCPNEESYVIQGYHLADRFGHFITFVPWDEKEEEEVNLNTMISVGAAKYACIEFIEEILGIEQESFDDKIHEWFSQKF